MGRSQYKIYEQEYPYFMTNSFVEGMPLFADRNAAQIVLDSLTFLQTQRGLSLYAYVLMENHFHIIAQAKDLSEKMRHFKSYTAREIINTFQQKKRSRLLRQLAQAKLKYKTQSDYQVWQESFYPKQIVGDQMMIQKIEYIQNNPVNRGYVDRPEDWRYSSARNYANIDGLTPLTLYHR